MANKILAVNEVMSEPQWAYGESQGENYSYLCSLVGMEDRAAFQVALRHERK